MPRTVEIIGKGAASGVQLVVRVAEGIATVSPIMGTAFGLGASCTVPPVALGIFVTAAVEKIRQVCNDWNFDSKQAESLPDEIDECARIIVQDMFPAVLATEVEDYSVLETSFLRVATKFIEMVDEIRVLCEKWNNKMIHKKGFATNKYKKKFTDLPRQLEKYRKCVLMAFEAEMHSYTHEKLNVLVRKADAIRSGVHDDVVAIVTEFADKINEKLDTLQQNDERADQKLDNIGEATDEIQNALTNLHMIEKPPDSTSLRACPIFFGREEQLKTLNDVLGVGGCMAALVGGAGMGKSHCASKFARQWFREDPAHRFVLWLEAETENVARVSYSNATETLGVKLPDANEKMTIRELAGLVWDHLRHISTQFEWMVVYDNVPEALGELEGPEAFAPMFFPAPLHDMGRGRILLTTRCASYGGHIKSLGNHYFERIMIEPLDESTAVTMLMHSLDNAVCASESETEAAKELVQLFGYLPLAIATANSQMVAQVITVSEYLDDLKGGLESGVHDAVTLALASALKYARIHGLGRVLDAAAFLSPDQLTLELLDCDRSTARRLCQLSLLRHDGGDVYSIHRMHQAAARDGISPSTAIGVMNGALETFDPQNSDTWRYGISLIPHLDSLVEHVEAMKKSGSIGIEFDNLEYAKLLHSSGTISHVAVHDFSGAMIKCKESLALKLQVYGPDAQNTGIAMTLGKLGGLERELGNYDKAREYYEESLQMMQHVYGTDAQNAVIAVTLHGLGNLEQDFSNFDTAREYYKESLEMMQQVYGADAQSDDLAATLCNLGELERKLGNYNKARDYYHASLKMKQNVHGPDAQNTDVALILNNLGDLENNLGSYDKARGYYEESLKMQQHVYGADAQNDDLAAMLNNLGSLEFNLGNYDNAHVYYEESLEAMQHVYGTDAQTADIAMVLRNLGSLEGMLGNYEKARGYYNASLVMLQHVYGSNAQNADLATTLGNFGYLEGELGNYEKAREFHRKSLKMKQQVYGPDAPNDDLAQTLNNLGSLEMKLGNYDKAREYYVESLEKRQHVSGGNAQDANLALTLENLGTLEFTLGNYDKARAKYEDALSMMVSNLGENSQNHPQVERIQKNLNDLAVLEMQQG